VAPGHFPIQQRQHRQLPPECFRFKKEMPVFTFVFSQFILKFAKKAAFYANYRNSEGGARRL